MLVPAVKTLLSMEGLVLFFAKGVSKLLPNITLPRPTDGVARTPEACEIYENDPYAYHGKMTI